MCKRNGYNFSVAKAKEIYHAAGNLIAVFLKDDNTRPLIQQAITLLNTTSQILEKLRTEMDHVASTLPEFFIVMAMNGVDSPLDHQLIAEIGAPTRFLHREALIVFADVDS